MFKRIGHKIRSFYHRNLAWCMDFSSAFVGTLLGIALTFGISAFIDFKDKQAAAKRITLYTMRTISQGIHRNEGNLRVFEARDSIYKIVLEKYDNNAMDSLSVQDATAFAAQLYNFNSHSENRSTEAIFMSDVDVWSNIDNTKVIEAVGESFDVLRSVENMSEELHQFFNDLYPVFYGKLAKYNKLENEQRAQKIISEVLSDTDVYLRFSLYYPIKISMLKYWLKVLNVQFEWLKMTLNITDNDIIDAFSDSSFDSLLEKSFNEAESVVEL